MQAFASCEGRYLLDETTTMDRYGVMGYPVTQSRSPVIHRLFAAQTRQAMRYELLEVAPEKLELAVRQFRRTGGKGLNITAPHKHAVASLCDRLSDRANVAGAVNTLTFVDDATVGDNTDGVGLLRDLQVNQGLSLRDSSILVLGAGGATAGIAGPLLSQEPARLVVANRSLDRAEALVRKFAADGAISACRFDDVPADEFQLVINATSAGLRGETPPWPSQAVGPLSACYDLSYGLKPTPFCQWARANQARTVVMGWGMLIEQAAESFLVWRGVRPDTRPVLRQLAVSA